MDRKAFLTFFHQLDRSLFLEDRLKSMASYDGPLPIGFGQTISQPSLVAQMTLELAPEPGHRVLEIGTGSGYQTALLAPFCQAVYTVERIQSLSDRARTVLKQLSYDNIYFRVGDGSEGWPQEAPFDRMMVTAAASEVPPALVEQLAAGGKLVIPVGPAGMQNLLAVTKDRRGRVREDVINQVSFVELVGPYGWQQER